MRERLMTWYSFLGGAIAWTLHLMGSYGLSEMLCLKNASTLLLTLVLSGLTLISLAISGSAFWIARRKQLELAAALDSKAMGNPFFMALTSVISNGFFSVVILAQALPVFMLRGACSWD